MSMKIYSFVLAAVNDKITRKKYVMETNQILIVLYSCVLELASA